MADAYDRVLGSLTDVVAVEKHAPGMVRIITISDAYVVDARNEVCECPDFEYNLDGDGRCKHLWRALLETDQLPLAPFVGLDSDLEEPAPLPDFDDYDPGVNYA